MGKRSNPKINDNSATLCPNCGCKKFEEFDEIRDGVSVGDMTDGEYSDYEAGTHGTLNCCNCGESIEFG